MTVSNIEKRSRQRSKKIREKQVRRKVLIILGILLVLAALIVAFIFVFKGNSYNDADSFEKYVKAYYDERHNGADADISAQEGTTETVTKYRVPISTAIEYPIINRKDINDRMKVEINEIIKGFKRDNSNATKKDKLALFVQSKAYSTPKEVISMVAYEEHQAEDDKDMRTISSDVHTYNFSTKTGMPLSSAQIFNNSYRAFCSKYMTAYFEGNYAKDLVKDSYKTALADREENFNEFVLTDTGVKFFFSKGTVVKEDLGEVGVDVRYKHLKKVLRDQILIRYIDPLKPMVALTYDDGPRPDTTNDILDCLKKYGVVATFFELGQNIQAYPAVIKREVKLGMEVGSHSWSHPDLKRESKKEVKRQLYKTNEVLRKVSGQTATVFRPPYGNTSAVVEKFANAPVILWSVDTLDWKSRNAKSVTKVVKGVKDLDGRVVLMHSIYDSTAEATEKLIPWLLDQGYQLVTVSELLEYRYKEIPKPGKLYGYGYFYLDAEDAQKRGNSEYKP